MSRNEQNKKIRAEMNKQNRKITEKISGTKSWFFEKINKVTNSVLDLTRL